jgi:hypothetical protein
VPTDRCSESRDDRRSPLHRDLIASLHEQCTRGTICPSLGAKLKAEVPAPISSPSRKPSENADSPSPARRSLGPLVHRVLFARIGQLDDDAD